jgi:hypothetical protein
MALKKYFIKSSDVLEKIENDTATIINKKTGKFATLTDVGFFIWEKLDRKTNKKELIRKIVKEYEINQDTADKDLESFLKEAIKEKIILNVDN